MDNLLLWCPCFQAWQPITARGEQCPEGGCDPTYRIEETHEIHTWKNHG